MFVLFYAILAAALAALSALFAVLLERAAPRWADRWQALCLVLVGLLVAWQLLPVAQAWWSSTKASLGIQGTGYTRYAVLAVALLVAWRLRRGGLVGTSARVVERLRGARGLLVGVIGLALVGMLAGGAWRVHRFGWQDAPTPAPASAERRPDVFLVMIDTLAAQDMSLYGYHLPTTPNLEAFAARSHVFEQFFAASNYTTASMASLLTGRHVSDHRVYHLDGHLAPADREQTLPRLLDDAGYATAGVISNTMAHPLHFRAHAGFDYLSEPLERFPASGWLAVIQMVGAKLLPPIRDAWWWPQVMRHIVREDDPALQEGSPFPPQLVARRAMEVLDQAGDQPVFLWAHFLPPHAPYLSPPPFRGRFLPEGEFDTWRQQLLSPASITLYPPEAQAQVDRLRLRYDEDIAWIDHEVGAFLRTLEAAGRLDNAIVILVSDHGESFERGFRAHRGPLLHDALVRVPLIVRLPGQTQGSRIGAYGGHVDLLPTVLELAGLAPAPWAQGASLAPLMRGEEAPDRPQLTMNLEAASRFAPVPAKGSLAVALRPHKLVHYLESGCEELFDLAADPRESVNLAATRAETADRLRALLSQRSGVPLIAPADRSAPCAPLAAVRGQLN